MRECLYMLHIYTHIYTYTHVYIYIFIHTHVYICIYRPHWWCVDVYAYTHDRTRTIIRSFILHIKSWYHVPMFQHGVATISRNPVKERVSFVAYILFYRVPTNRSHPILKHGDVISRFTDHTNDITEKNTRLTLYMLVHFVS